MGFNSAFKGVKIVKNPGNGRLNNLNDPVLNVLIRHIVCVVIIHVQTRVNITFLTIHNAVPCLHVAQHGTTPITSRTTSVCYQLAI